MNRTLYKMDKGGKTRVWSISTDRNCIDISYGTLNGEHQHERHIIDEGKAGRSIMEQVELVCKSKINRKKNGGYVEDIKDISSELKNQLGLKRPMLASKIKYDKVDFSAAYVQRKYDGHRCLITMQDGVLQAYSRGGKPITSIDHILSEISLSEGETLDGELYIHGVPLQTISSKVRKQNTTAHDLRYIVYDYIGDFAFIERLREAWEKISECNRSTIAETIQVHGKEEIIDLFNKFRNEKYEGAIVRHGTENYEVGRRSKYLMKVKEFFDDEFKITGVTASAEGWAILHCETKEGKIFKCSAPGTHAEKRHVLENIEDFVGKFVRVEFAEWTIDRKPSQPVATMFRNKEDE